MSAINLISLGRKLNNIYTSLCQNLCRQYDISQTCLDVLLCCADDKGYNTARDICTVRGLKSGIASVAVETLIQRGLLVRTEDERDRRVKRLVPTKAAQPLIEAGRAQKEAFVKTMEDGFTDGEREMLFKLIRKLLANSTHVFPSVELPDAPPSERL